jgi:chromosome segregation ATPase
MADSPGDRRRTEERLRALETGLDRVGGSLAEISQRLSAHQRHTQSTDEALQHMETLVAMMDERLTRLESVATTGADERTDNVLDIQPARPVLGPEFPPEFSEPLVADRAAAVRLRAVR